MKRSQIKPKRDRPRRDDGRVKHGRIKPKANSKIKTPFEIRHMERVAGLGCIVCGFLWVTLHHVTASIHGGRIARSHKLVVPLCPLHHLIQWGPKESVEALGHGGFFRTHGIDLLAEAYRLLRETEEEENGDI